MMRKLLLGLVAVAAVLIPAGASTAQETPDECHPSYDPCLPIVADIDCAGGTGDGPVWVEGPVTVTGPDEYDLDRDGDGIGCETAEACTPTQDPCIRQAAAEPEPEPEAEAPAPVEVVPEFTG